MNKFVTLFFRDKREGIYSIERLFASLEPYFSKEFACNRVTVPVRPNRLVAIVWNMLYARKNAAGVNHITGDAHYLAIFLGKRTLLTIHDCGDYHKMKGWRGWVYRWLWFKLPCRMATKISVISESTKKILEEEVGTLGDKIVVIENCVTLDRQVVCRKFNSTNPVILQIGTGRHKNLDNLIKALEGLTCRVHIVGNPSQQDRESLVNLGIIHTIEFNVPDNRLAEIYKECDLLFFASRYEGFGLPILEAQASGMPVITSNTMSMPDVAAGGAILVDPESPTEIRAAVERIISNEEFRSRLVAEGLRNVGRFAPEVIAQKYMRVYEDIMNCT